jgi:hypothetical protein
VVLFALATESLIVNLGSRFPMFHIMDAMGIFYP